MNQTKQPLEERLIGKKVALEIKLNAGTGVSEKDNARQTMYCSGIYEGLESIGNRDHFFLKNGSYWTSTGLGFTDKDSEGKEKINKFFAFDEAYIKSDDVLIISLLTKDKDANK